MANDKGQTMRRKLGTDEARTRLSRLVQQMRRLRKPSRHLLENAYEIGPHRKGGAVLLPEVDAVAAAERIEELEAENEDLAIALLLRERAGESTAEGVPLDVVIRELGFTRDELHHVVAVLAAAERENLTAYRRAKPRLIERLRQHGGQHGQ